MPKIAIVGTFGVGKTTLFEALKKHPKYPELYQQALEIINQN